MKIHTHAPIFLQLLFKDKSITFFKPFKKS